MPEEDVPARPQIKEQKKNVAYHKIEERKETAASHRGPCEIKKFPLKMPRAKRRAFQIMTQPKAAIFGKDKKLSKNLSKSVDRETGVWYYT